VTASSIRGSLPEVPLLIVPGVISEGLRNELLDLRGHGGWFAAKLPSQRGKPVPKTRRERHLFIRADAELLYRIDVEMSRKLLPEVARAYGYRITHRERYKIGCYEASEYGQFQAHRDNPSPHLAYRRISVSINLNDDYEGCELQFPERGSALYRPAPATAIAFPSELLHLVTRVTRGRRFVMVTHLFEGADEEIRRAARQAQGKQVDPSDTLLYGSLPYLSCSTEHERT
jgi:hypothetical protein